MNVTQNLETLLNGSKQDKTIEKFQQEYVELLSKGVIHRKGYTLAGINVVGDKTPIINIQGIAAVDTQ